MKPWLSKHIKNTRELPLQSDDNARFMPWIMAVMVFLLTLALALAMATHNAFVQWDTKLISTITVQVPSPSLAERKTDSAEARVKKVADYLRRVEGIENVQPVDAEEAIDLLETWLGEGNIRAELPVPRLIDFSMAADAELDLTDIEDHLAELVPGTQLDDHKLWLDELLAFGNKIAITAGIVALVIAVATAVMIIFATRSGLVTHQPTIELLHIMGARNNFIARQFAKTAFVLGFFGGLFGLCIGLFLLYGLSQSLTDIVQGLLPNWDLTYMQLAAIASLPIGAGFLALLVAYTTVLYKLSRIV